MKLGRYNNILLVQLRGCGESKGSGIAHVALETVLEILLAKVRELEILKIVEVDVNVSFVELYVARCGKHRCKSVEVRAQEDQNGQKSVSLHFERHKLGESYGIDMDEMGTGLTLLRHLSLSIRLRANSYIAFDEPTEIKAVPGLIHQLHVVLIMIKNNYKHRIDRCTTIQGLVISLPGLQDEGF